MVKSYQSHVHLEILNTTTLCHKGWPAKVSQEIDQWPGGRRPMHHIQVTILEYLAANQEMQNDAE